MKLTPVLVIVSGDLDSGVEKAILPLLHHLHRSTEDSSAEVRLAIPEAALEAVGPAADKGCRRDDLALVLLVGDDLGDLRLDVLGVLDRKSTRLNSSHSGESRMPSSA